MAAGADFAGLVNKFAGRGLGEVDGAPLREDGDPGAAKDRNQELVALCPGRVVSHQVNLLGLVDGLLLARDQRHCFFDVDGFIKCPGPFWVVESLAVFY